MIFERARNFIYRNARPLDFARWKYHFENGSVENVLKTLASYQNDDGGFGHALEPDCWNPNSSPIQTWSAIELLKEIDFNDTSNPVVQGILRYLASGEHFNGHFWHNTIPSNNDYPHAPWWHTNSDSTCHNDYNPTACLAGFIVKYADKSSDLYNLGCRIVQEALKSYMERDMLNDTFTVRCYISMMEYIGSNELDDKLIRQTNHSITKNTDEWLTGYVCKPSDFINSKDSIFYESNKDLADYECEFIISTQLADGSWNISWNWSDYIEEWHISKNWWKANGIINNILYLKNFNKILYGVK